MQGVVARGDLLEEVTPQLGFKSYDDISQAEAGAHVRTSGGNQCGMLVNLKDTSAQPRRRVRVASDGPRVMSTETTVTLENTEKTLESALHTVEIHWEEHGQKQVEEALVLESLLSLNAYLLLVST